MSLPLKEYRWTQTINTAIFEADGGTAIYSLPGVTRSEDKFDGVDTLIAQHRAELQTVMKPGDTIYCCHILFMDSHNNTSVISLEDYQSRA